MKTSCVALKQFLFAGMVLAVGQLFKTTKIHAGELQARGLARPATAEELQAQAGIDPQGDAGELDDSDAPQGDTDGPDAPADQEQQDQPDESESNEPEPDAAGGDTESSEEPSAPVPKRRGRKSAS